MRVFDCFTFFNELELLEFRFNILYEHVDHFVIAEANKTHTGKDKDFIFEQNKDRFSDFLDKVIYVKVEDLPSYRESMKVQGMVDWIPENFQRNCLARGLNNQNLTAEDRIVVSDLDEIPNPETLKANLHHQAWVSLRQKLYYYYINCEQKQMWDGPVVASPATFGACQDLRNNRGINAIENGGWHFSFMGGASRIQEKIQNIAESNLVKHKVMGVDDIENKMKTQTDLFDRDDDFAQKRIVEIDDTFPKETLDFVKKYPQFLFSEH